ncbi:MAG: hypothetical protein HYV60_10650 [Planctomycetia bacterium]|nr:hypothetical protein [Planctomycetia bacterium]
MLSIVSASQGIAAPVHGVGGVGASYELGGCGGVFDATVASNLRKSGPSQTQSQPP